ncbi:hypothetical protein BMF94_3271 [Rhodotorula taiwanensis]|uniref:Uncharacterized protein n=1 Tax=Rhodotorula taiwanensis TaxID=741276 RepID=A0A2S5BAD4_9BASI|nr:hypothetical protein BMF94_3271 [Rhodotorula taiwanensis]
MARTKAGAASVKASTLGPIPPYAPWREFLAREKRRLQTENSKLTGKKQVKHISKLYAAAKAEKENAESDE